NVIHKDRNLTNGYSEWYKESSITINRIINNRTEIYVGVSGQRIWHALTLEQGKKYKITFEARTHVSGREISVGRGTKNLQRIAITDVATSYEAIFESDGSSDFSIFFHDAGTYEIGNVQVVETTAVSNAQLSVLNDNINMRVSKGELMSQINIEAGRTLIQSNKLYLDAQSVVFSGQAFIPGAVIENASIDGAKNADATIGSAKINDLDVNKMVGNRTEFVSSAWNSVNSTLKIDATNGMRSIGTKEEFSLTNGRMELRSSAQGYDTRVRLDGVGLRFTTDGKSARMRYNGTNIVMDNGSLGMNRNHINSVDWIRIVGQEGDTMDTAIFNSPNHPGSIIADTRQITIGHGSRAEVTRVASFAGSIHFMKNLYMDGNNINDIFAVRLSGTSTMLTGSIGSLGGGALIDRTAITIGLRNGSTDESRAFDRVAEFYVRIHIDRKLAYNG